MYARVTRVSLKPDKIDSTKEITESQILPDMKDDPGFKGFYVLGDRTSGDSMVITMWDSEDTESSSREKVGQRFGMLSEALADQPESPTTYEVIHSYVPEQSPAM